ncbi:MAG: RluA family pseudouridine synthase [Spirochaetes bacterium]|jgi:RluA family pseudouridine synthase|nr:RluA family pseudouridine synthase [Spirochaetota bacterium]
MKRINQSIVPRHYSDLRLDSYLAKRFCYLSREKWKEEILLGKVLQNGEKVLKHDRRIKEGDLIEYDGVDIIEPEIDRNYSILYEDAHILAVDKPGNIPVHPVGRFFNHTLLVILQNDLNIKLYTLHRLDRETSGVILFAKDFETASAIQKNFKKVRKKYMAIVSGIMKNDGFTIDMPMGPATNSEIKSKMACYSGAELAAVTHLKKIKIFGSHTLVEAAPVTGRQHQIRAHLSHVGLPVLGDKLYGPDEKLYLDFIRKGNTEDIIKRAGFFRTALHSKSIIFMHPALSREIEIESPLPECFIEYISNGGE